jgi:hypothetical protein
MIVCADFVRALKRALMSLARLKPCPPTFVQIPFNAGYPFSAPVARTGPPRKTSPEAVLAAITAGAIFDCARPSPRVRRAADRKQVPRLRRSFASQRIFFARNDRNLGMQERRTGVSDPHGLGFSKSAKLRLHFVNTNPFT